VESNQDLVLLLLDFKKTFDRIVWDFLFETLSTGFVPFDLVLFETQWSNLTPSPSFGHNLCFRCLNEQCEPIVDMYIPRDFQ
jgi:hypothetical protein